MNGHSDERDKAGARSGLCGGGQGSRRAVTEVETRDKFLCLFWAVNHSNTDTDTQTHSRIFLKQLLLIIYLRRLSRRSVYLVGHTRAIELEEGLREIIKVHKSMSLNTSSGLAASPRPRWLLEGGSEKERRRSLSFCCAISCSQPEAQGEERTSPRD